MSIHLPAAGIGNSRSLATIGTAGELMGFFYPHLDFAQNVREGMFAVYIEGDAGSRLVWCFDDGFERAQRFESDSNILLTTLRHRGLGLSVELCDLLPPEEHALVRRVRVEHGTGIRTARFMQYFRLAVGDNEERNAVHHLERYSAVVQHLRGICLAAASGGPISYHVGGVSLSGVSDTKKAMESGRLGGPHQAMGRVDFAVALEAGPASSWEANLVLAGGDRIETAAATARRLADQPFEELRGAVQRRCRGLLDHCTPCPVDEFAEPYNTALFVLHDLYDAEQSTFIAAPEFDPGYRYSGGYGYCWPRDAAVSGMVMARVGFADEVAGFFDWAARCQLEDGHWFQRYWCDGAEAPSWCVRYDELQLDQTCAMLHAAGCFADLLDGARREAFIGQMKDSAQRAAEAILNHVGADGLHLPAADLWECCYGSFAYTQAAVLAALRRGHEVFGTPAPDEQLLRGAMFDRLWDDEQGVWARRIDPEGQLDRTMDSSCLGLIYPWDVLDLSDPQDVRVAERTIESVAERLTVETPGGKAILRFERESYMGGGAGCVNTLWLALCRLKLAVHVDPDTRRHQVEEAQALIQTALAHTNPVGQLPELIPALEFPYWAAPHGWASALLIDGLLELGRINDAKAKARSTTPVTSL